jgi:hypothetical protein
VSFAFKNVSCDVSLKIATLPVKWDSAADQHAFFVPSEMRGGTNGLMIPLQQM